MYKQGISPADAKSFVAARRNPMFPFLMVLTMSSTIGLQAWTTLFNNFAVEVASLRGDHIGIIQSVREIPGLLTLLAVFMIRIIPEHRLSVISIFVLGIGIATTGFFPSYIGLLATTLGMSFGFHYYETTNQSLTLQYFDVQIVPWVFGKLRSLAAASNVVIGAFIYGVTYFLDYRQIYLVVGIFIMMTAVWGFMQDPEDRNLTPQWKKLIFRRKYWLYYFLTFMAGARRQIFIAFSVLLLVQKFDFSVREITLLFLINNSVNYFLSPLIGRCIIGFGERKVLSLEYFSLIFIFVAYATTSSKLFIAVLYILDHIFFNFAIAIRSYFQKIGDPRDIAPSMAVGFTINHIAAVVLPALGGLAWVVDYRIPFFCGAAMACISLLAVQGMRMPD
jgi:hypothetical protein